MTVKQCAAYLLCTQRAVFYYEAGARKIPGPVVALMERLKGDEG